MSYKTILVHCENEKSTHQLLEVACRLARSTEAHLIGLYPYAPVYLPAIMDEAYGSELIAYQRQRWEKESAEIKQIFESVVANQPFVSEWRATETFAQRLSTIVAEQSRTVDLVVVSQSPEVPTNSASDVPETVVFESGRSVLVVPNSGPGVKDFDRILVAWNSTKESARAVFDALPLLKNAKDVRILSIMPEKDEAEVDIPGAEIASALARHGVNVDTAERITAGGPAGEVLVNYVADHKFDLLVMGCYGHSRLRQFVFGGVTQYVLANMKTPVLLAH
ncbi:MAG: universal stress protein [Hyphomicrobiaceae bacterium]